jgi:hypothetical protein
MSRVATTPRTKPIPVLMTVAANVLTASSGDIGDARGGQRSEYRNASAVVEEGFALDDRGQTCGYLEAAEQADQRHWIRSGHNRGQHS